MLEQFRETPITWDKASRKVYEPLRASAGDNKGRKLSVQVVNGGVIESLSGASLSLFWETKDKAHNGLDAFDPVDATKGEFEIYYTTGMLSNEGTLNANLVLVDASGRIVSEPFSITVFKGIDDDAIQSSDSFTALTEALAQVGTINNKADRDELLALESTFEQNKVSVEQQLQDNTNSLIFLGNRKYGVIGDNVTDDSDAFEAVLNQALINGKTVIIPNMQIKVTRPIVINFKNGTRPHPSFKVLGVGGIGDGRLQSYGSQIIGYNIPDKRAVIELLGTNNGIITSTSFENIEIKLDEPSCDSLSFCLLQGDSWFFNHKKVKFTGYNSVLLRCGTADGATTYANMMCKFEQCDFNTTRYVDWDGTTLKPKAKYGFAITNERMFYDNNQVPYMSDSITFDTCLFGGTVFNYIQQAVYTNCMWLIPGNYRPVHNPQDTPHLFNLGFLENQKINTGIGLWVVGGKVTLINPYFEDVREGVFIRSLFGQVPSVLITNPMVLGTLNNRPIINGTPLNALYFIKSELPIPPQSHLSICGGTFNKGNTGFDEGFFINNGLRTFEIENVSGVYESEIVDNYSRRRKVVENSKPYLSYNNVSFKGKMNGGRLTVEGTTLTNIPIHKNSHLVQVECIVNGKTQGNHPLYVYRGGDVRFTIQNVGTGHTNAPYLEYYSSGNNEVFLADRLPWVELPGFDSFSRFQYFKKGDTIGLALGADSGALDNTLDVVVKLTFEG